MTSKMLLEQYMAERHALGFSLKTDEGCIHLRRAQDRRGDPALPPGLYRA